MISYTLNIADYKILLTSVDKEVRLKPAKSQQSFIIPDSEYDLAINVFRGPVSVRDEAECMFRAPYVEEIKGVQVKRNDEFWTVYKHGDHIFIRTAFPQSEENNEALLTIRPGEKIWDLVIDSVNDKINPLQYPLDGLIIYYLTALNGDVFIHGSGLEFNKKGYLFSGKSGRGKTMMAGIFNDKGGKIIHDDRLIIRQQGNRFIMYNTPVYDNERSSKVELSSIWLIEHGMENHAYGLSHTDAITGVMVNCIQHHWNTELIGKLTGALLKLVSKVPVMCLKFVPDDEVIAYIENYGE